MGQSSDTVGGKTALSTQAIRAATVPVALPTEGEAMLSAKTCAAVLEISESTWWAWVSEPGFPVQPVRQGERWTRFRLSELRSWMASLGAGDAKESPAQRSRRAKAEATGA